jgi:ketosteroid isomerase-like protein
MSQENVELARQYCETFNAHGVDGTRRLRHPAIELHDPPDLPDAGRHIGEQSVEQRIESYLALGWDGQIRVEEYIDAGSEVVVVWRLTGETPLSGVPVEATWHFVCLFENGRLRRIRQYLQREQALEAVGLRASS